MPLSQTNKVQSQSIEDLIAQLDCPSEQNSLNSQSTNHSPNSSNFQAAKIANRKSLKGKRTTSLSLSISTSSSPSSSSSFQRTNSNGQNSSANSASIEPLLQKNILTSKKYTKNLKSLNNRGLPKKNGAGGKHTWGAPGCELAEYYIDTKDPNYDSEDQANEQLMSYASKNQDYLKELDLDDFEQEIKPIILEYFQNGDTIEVIDYLKCYNLNRCKPQLVAYFIQIALENNNTSKELMSRLLRDLTFEILDESDYSTGFDLLLKNLNEITLDNPDASEKCGTFIARAIADKVLTRKYIDRFYDESYLAEVPDLNNQLIFKAVESGRLLVSMNNHLYQLSHIWGNKGGFLAVTELTDKIKEIIQELYDSRDVDEAVRCLKELNVPHFHHELVFEVNLKSK